jgi:hypothetical protein
MIYIIIEHSYLDSIPKITAHSNQTDYETHLNKCNDMLYENLELKGDYTFNTFIVPYFSNKDDLCKSISSNCNGGIKQTLISLQNLLEE